MTYSIHTIPLHYIALHYIITHYITLHYITLLILLFISTCKNDYRYVCDGICIYIYTVKPASWHQAQENMNGRCNLSHLNALFAEGKTHMPWAQNWDHTFGSWATNFSIVAPFLGPESGPCFGATKHKQELVNTGSKCATADTSWQQHISVILRGYMPEALALPLIWGSSFGALGPPRLWEEAPPKP